MIMMMIARAVRFLGDTQSSSAAEQLRDERDRLRFQAPAPALKKTLTTFATNLYLVTQFGLFMTHSAVERDTQREREKPAQPTHAGCLSPVPMCAASQSLAQGDSLERHKCTVHLA